MKEVIEAAHQLGGTKAPRLDGLHGKFYHHHWEDLKQGAFKEVQSFLNSRILNPELNRTHISLIPKIPNLEKPKQYHPISLCNFAYKIIRKLLVNRLKPWMPNFISKEQSAFVSGRQIQDNILIV